MGVPAESVNSGEQLAEKLKAAMEESGPKLIEMMM